MAQCSASAQLFPCSMPTRNPNLRTLSLPRSTSYTVDITSLSTYQPKYRLLSSRHVDYPFHSYKSMSKQDAEGRIWRLHSTLDGDRGTFDTIWDFSKPGQVKYSFYMTNWTFPSSSSTDFLKINFFSAIREPFVGAKSQYPCFVANVGNVFQFGSTVSIVRRSDFVLPPWFSNIMN